MWPSTLSSIGPDVKIALLDEAQRRFAAENEWWRENRDAKELFIEEFERTLEQLRSMPGSGSATVLQEAARVGG